ncbi:MAG: hypothetical protein KKH72_12780 [Alphaproteobacteria bacterium]|nr:hypothetical protein [Alphaproteobacteria bacterium]
MKKLAIAALLSVSITAPAFAMEIKDYPRTAEEVEYCVKAQMDKDTAVPYGCMTLGQRILYKLANK